MDIINDTMNDTIMMLPFLFLTYLVIEFIERRKNNDTYVFQVLQKFGPLVGAFIGIIPQCGFSIVASMLFLNRNITLGTLISVFIATSDEAIPILLSNPKMFSSMLVIIIFKVLVAIIVGFIIDKIVYRKQKLILFTQENSEKEGSMAPCCYVQYPLVISALLRSLKIFVFLFVTTFILNFLLSTMGTQTISHLLLSNTVFQPIIAAIFGFIPNCAASVVLTQLYVAGQVSFASLFAGLISNAGLGLIVLMRYGESKKTMLKVILTLFISAIFVGFLLQVLNFKI